MEGFKFWANIINLFLAIFACLGGAFTLFFIVFRLKITVINKCLIVLNLILVFCLPVGNIIYSMGNIKLISIPLFTPISLTMAFGGHSLRFAILAIVVERLFATVYWRTYQIRPKFQNAIAVSLTASAIFLSLSLTFLTQFLKISLSYRNIVILFTHIGSLIVTLFLIHKNKKLHLVSRFRPVLLQRYQLSQNLKNLKILTPYITILATMGPINPIIYQILFMIEGNKTEISIPVLYSLYDLSLIICAVIFLLSMYKSQFQKNKLAVSSTSSKQVQTAFGTYLPTLQTVEDYFGGLKNTWM